MTRIVIDTDGVRNLAQYTRGAIDQVAHIRLELMRAERELNHHVGADAYGPLLARLTDFVTVLSEDHRMLVQEVLALEAEEGAAPAGATPATTTPERTGGPRPLDFGKVIPLLLTNLPSAPPPQPWNTGWVTAGGVIPLGAPTRPVTGTGPGTAGPDGFGPKWETRSAGVSTSYEAGVGGSRGRGPDGTHYGSWEAYQRMVAEARAAVAGRDGDLHYRGEVKAGVEAAASMHVWYSTGPDGAAVGGTANAEVKVYGSASGGAGIDGVGQISGGVDGEAGANANISAGAALDDDGISAGYAIGAYAGTQGGAAVGGDLGPISSEYGARVGTGVGVKASGGLSLDFDDIGFDFSATLGVVLSLGIDLSIHISPSGIIEGIGAVFNGDNPFEASGREWREQAAEQARQVAAEARPAADPQRALDDVRNTVAGGPDFPDRFR